ncbi:MAG: ribosome recycling factor [Actinomycetota bacterium]
MIDELLGEAAAKMDQAIQHVQAEFSTVRTGRANAGILHRVMVDYYGALTPLQQLASIAVPEPQLLVISPYDKSSVSAIEKAIQASDLGLNPASDGNVLRLVFPPLNEERRRELIKMIRHMAEDARISIRNVRRHSKDDMEALEGEVSTDEVRRGEARLQELTDARIAKIDQLVQHKETELLEV